MRWIISGNPAPRSMEFMFSCFIRFVQNISIVPNGIIGVLCRKKVQKVLAFYSTFHFCLKFLGIVLRDQHVQEEYPVETGLVVPGPVAQSVGHLTRKSEVLGLIPGLATYFRFSFRWFERGICQLLAKVCARSTA